MTNGTSSLMVRALVNSILLHAIAHLFLHLTRMTNLFLLLNFVVSVLFFPPKQEVDFTSTYQTGNASLFYSFGSGEV